jgi:hypothetical protein
MEPPSIPPLRKRHLSPLTTIAERLRPLVGAVFPLTSKTRTDGANLRKLVNHQLSQSSLPPPCPADQYTIVPPKAKGLPRILREFIETKVVTTGESYNLQVWNRNPASATVQVEFTDGSGLLANDVRFVFARIQRDRVESVLVLTPHYIVENFGQFGKETVKQQLIIPPATRRRICDSPTRILFAPDSRKIKPFLASGPLLVGDSSIHDESVAGEIISLKEIKRIAEEKLLGRVIPPGATKNRGQSLEALVADWLGYRLRPGELLAGGYPDFRHQALETKVQDSPTVDLGRFSPQFDEAVPGCPGFTTCSIRYLIALPDSGGVCRGVILCPGEHLGEHATYVGAKSFKCQRSIPMSFFDHFRGQSVANPLWRQRHTDFS